VKIFLDSLSSSTFDAKAETLQTAFLKNKSFLLFIQTTQALSYHLYSKALNQSISKGIEFSFQL